MSNAAAQDAEMHQDRYGLALTTASEAAAAAYRDGFDRILSAWTGADEAFERAIAADPDFALAHVARARVHAIYAEGAAARAKAAHARKLAATATQRERRHVEIIALAIEGQSAAALAQAEQHLDECPHDALVLALLLGAFGLYAFAGRADHDAAKLAICERHARHYGEDWWFLTYLGWSHTEAGNVGFGQAVTERALSLRRENAHGAHALAHALFERGDVTAGQSFLERWLLDHHATFMRGHLCWHLALVALDAGDVDGALTIYRDSLRPANFQGPPINAFTDSASLLWRLALRDSAPDDDWREVAAYGAAMYPRAGVHFVDVHWALAAAATKNGAFAQRLAELEALHADGKLAPGRAAIDLCRGMARFANGENDAAIRILEPLMPEVVRIGGSHAQRELYEDTLIVACLRAGQLPKARKLIDERLHRRPSARDQAWLTQAHQDAR
jgi:tetratricopeptide (TPR) repeat protein